MIPRASGPTKFAFALNWEKKTLSKGGGGVARAFRERRPNSRAKRRARRRCPRRCTQRRSRRSRSSARRTYSQRPRALWTLFSKSSQRDRHWRETRQSTRSPLCALGCRAATSRASGAVAWALFSGVRRQSLDSQRFSRLESQVSMGFSQFQKIRPRVSACCDSGRDTAQRVA